MIKKIIFYLSLFFLVLINVLVDMNTKNYISVLEKCFNRTLSLNTNYFILIYFIFTFISILIAITILLVVFKNKEEQKGLNLKSDNGVYGTADWLNIDEAKKILGLNNENGLILGRIDKQVVRLPFDSYFNKNILSIGSSGSMKSIAFILPNILELAINSKSMIISDSSKGDLYKKTSELLRNMGYTVKVLNLCDMAHSDRWNPLSEIENINDAQSIADITISNTQKHNKNSDDFWPRAEENLLKAFILYFHERMIETNTLSNIYHKIASQDVSDIANMFNSLKSDSPARMSYNIFAQGSDTVKASVLTGLRNKITSISK